MTPGLSMAVKHLEPPAQHHLAKSKDPELGSHNPSPHLLQELPAMEPHGIFRQGSGPEALPSWWATPQDATEARPPPKHGA